MRTLRALVEQYPNCRSTGLHHEQVANSLQNFGANRLTALPKEPLWQKFLGKFDEAIIKILLAATLLKTVVDLFAASTNFGLVGLGLVVVVVVGSYLLRWQEWLPAGMFVVALVLVALSVVSGHPSYEGLAVMMAILLATGVAFLSEYKSDREFEVLNAQKDSITVKVKRQDTVQTIPVEEVVVGDLIVLAMGDEIPADGRLVQANEVLIDQSLLTGESEPVNKSVMPDEDTGDGPDQPGCLYRGTQVIEGAGLMLAAEVGDGTMIGQIARRLSQEGDTEDERENRVQRRLTMTKEETPLQEKLGALAQLISKLGYTAAIAIFLVLLVRGVVFTHDIRFAPEFIIDPATGEYVKDALGHRVTDPTLGTLENNADVLRASIGAVLDYFVYMVIVIVVAVPEGLPMSVTVSLALAMRKMTRANCLVRQLVACETIGSATVICSDKTGTLTQNKMQVERLGVGGAILDRSQAQAPTSALRTPADWIAFNGMVNSTANLEQRDGKLVPVGNSTEAALLLWAQESGLNYAERRIHHPIWHQQNFTSDRKRMTSVVEGEGRLVVLVKGAPEVLLGLCTQRLDANGDRVDLTEADRTTLTQQLHEVAGQAMRTLAFAHRQLPLDTPRDKGELHAQRENLEQELVFAGFVAIRDPLRPDVNEAMAQCREAGIAVKMITGDNIETAKAIGREIGLLDDPQAIALTSPEFNQLSDDEVRDRLPRITILARAKPLDKFRMVRLLQDLNHVVAVTGDGTNDAPALKKADVGLAMGIAGTEVAKEASKIVLLDDSFATIVTAVKWGRSLYENIQRFIQFQLTINVSALLIAFLGPFFNVTPPFTVLQLLWINVIMDTFAAIALCSEAPRAGLMTMPPKRRDESIITAAMRSTILGTALFFVVVMLGILLAFKTGWLGDGEPVPTNWAFSPLDVRQVSLFFTIYVLFQVWNQINCRSLTPSASGVTGVFKNPVFMGIMGAILVGQIAIITFGGAIFSVKPLSVLDWLVISGSTASVLVFAEVWRRLRR